MPQARNPDPTGEKRTLMRRVEVATELHATRPWGTMPMARDALENPLRRGTVSRSTVPPSMARRSDADRTTRKLREGEVGAGQLIALATRLARLHAAPEHAAPTARGGEFKVVAQRWDELFERLGREIGFAATQELFDKLVRLAQQELDYQRDRIERRAAAGRLRAVRGDLRLDDIHFDKGELTIHFDPLASPVVVDPVAEVAPLAAELGVLGFSDLADVLVGAYFEATGDPDGRVLLPIYTAFRSAYRAAQLARRARDTDAPHEARRVALDTAKAELLHAVGSLARPSERPCLVMMCGYPGTGKSVLAQGLADAQDFVVLRSDVIRKELAGEIEQRPVASPEAGVYGRSWTEKTYATARARARAELLKGGRVIIDATFRDDGTRVKCIELARALRVPVRILFCNAPPKVVKSRLEERLKIGDDSDADWDVYRHMREIWEPFGAMSARIVDTVTTDRAVIESLQRGVTALRGAGLVGR